MEAVMWAELTMPQAVVIAAALFAFVLGFVGIDITIHRDK